MEGKRDIFSPFKKKGLKNHVFNIKFYSLIDGADFKAFGLRIIYNFMF